MKKLSDQAKISLEVRVKKTVFSSILVCSVCLADFKPRFQLCGLILPMEDCSRSSYRVFESTWKSLV